MGLWEQNSEPHYTDKMVYNSWKKCLFPIPMCNNLSNHCLTINSINFTLIFNKIYLPFGQHTVTVCKFL